MVYEDIRSRHSSLFAGPQNHRSSATTTVHSSIPSSSSTSTTAAGIAKKTARSILDALDNPKEALDSGSDSDSSLDNLGPATGKPKLKTIPSSTLPKSTQHWHVPPATTTVSKKAKASSSNSSIPLRQPVASTSSSSKSASLKSQSTSSRSQPNNKAYSSSASSTRNRANSPHKSTSTSGKSKGKEREVAESHRKNTKKVTELDDSDSSSSSSSEEEAPLPAKKAKKKLIRASDATAVKGVRKEDSQDIVRGGIVEHVPFQRQDVHVPDFLFTPEEVQNSPPQPAPISGTSTSSKENRNGASVKQSSSSKYTGTKASYKDIPEVPTHPPRAKEAKKKDKSKKKKDQYKYEEDLEYPSEDMEEDGRSSTTMSDGISASSTTSLRDQTSRTKLDTSPPKPNYTPNTRRALLASNRTPAASGSGSGSRSPIVGRAIKSGASVSQPSCLEQPQTVKKLAKKEEREHYLPSGNSGPARSSPPPLLRFEAEHKPSRKAKPAVTTTKSTSKTADSRRLERGRASSSSSSSTSQLHGSSYSIQAERRPLADKQITSSSKKNTKENLKHAAASYVEINSSPEKAGQSRRVTLSSGQHADIDEDEEESFVVADSSTVRDTGTTVGGKKTRVPISSVDIQKKWDGGSRGMPSPVFGKAKQDKSSASSSNPQRRKAIPSAKASESANGTQGKHADNLAFFAESRPSTPGKSSSRREVEIVEIPSVSPRKRSNRPESSKDALKKEERRAKRRSVEREDEDEKEKIPKSRRSFSPMEATQALWNKAARGDGRMTRDFDMSLGLEDDSDDDVPLTDFQEKVLCPFCDRPLPPRPSRRLIDQLSKLCYRVDVQVRNSPANNMALRLPPSDTASFCKRHTDESDIIPAGEAAGYPKPSSVSWRDIAGRIHRDIISDLYKIISKRSHSSFYDDVLKEWEEQGARKMGNVRNQYSTFYLELPGYYGQRGFQTILHVLTGEFVTKGVLQPHVVSPLTVEVYLRRVLVPETAVRLIQGDRGQGCKRSEALKILEESRDYGAAVFGDMDIASSLLFKETQAERDMRVEEEEAAASQREDLLSSQGQQAEALKIGEAIIAKLRKATS